MPNSARHRAPANYVAHLLSLLERWQVPPGALLADTGLSQDELLEPERSLPLDTWLQLLSRARSLSDEPAIGIHMGLQIPASAHGYLGLGALTAPTLQDAIALLLRYGSTRSTALALRGHVEEGLAVLRIEERADLGEVRDVVLLCVMVGLWQAGSSIIGRRMRLQLELPIAEPAYVARFAHVLPAMRFDRPLCQLTGPADGLQSPVTMADAAAFRLAQQECNRLFEASRTGADFATRARQALPTAQGFRSFEALAQALGVSTRTLRRRLSAESTSYASLLDEERMARALVLLRAPELSTAQVAERLGYADASTFGRAFQRWLGKTPAVHRRALSDGTAD